MDALCTKYTWIYERKFNKAQMCHVKKNIKITLSLLSFYCHFHVRCATDRNTKILTQSFILYVFMNVLDTTHPLNKRTWVYDGIHRFYYFVPWTNKCWMPDIVYFQYSNEWHFIQRWIMWYAISFVGFIIISICAIVIVQ